MSSSGHSSDAVNLQMYSDLDIEYFERALDWLLARDEVCKENGVGLSGISQVTYIYNIYLTN